MSDHSVIEKTVCKHCGELCLDETIHENDATFCCAGCQTVFHLLNDAGLGAFYNIDEAHPGTSMRKASTDTRFDFLDDPSIRHKILDFDDGKTARITLRLPQIHCVSCIWLLENIHRLNPNIAHSEVYFDKREAAIRFHIDKLSISNLSTLLASIGYEPDFRMDLIAPDAEKSPSSDYTPGTPSAKKSSESKKSADYNISNRPLYLKIGIAGFAFGNIMLFSLPEYLAGPDGVDTQFLQLFGALNIALALPVFLYSSLDFFRPAITGIRQRQWNMDIAISLGIIAMFFRSLYEIGVGLSVGYMDSFTMLVFLLLIGRLFQQKTYDRLSFERDFRSYFPLSVIRLMPDGTEESVAATFIKENDTLVIRNGELLPADSILLDEKAYMDFSFVTGESDPVLRQKGEIVYAGGRNTGTSIRFKVIKPVSGSYLTRLWNNDIFRKPKEETIRSLSQRFSRYFSPGVLVIAAASALFWLPTRPDLAINAFTAVLIIACPCALALSAPFTLGWATNLLGKARLFLKNSETTEHLANIDTIVFDKTGTLTERDKSDVTFVGRDLSAQESAMLLQVMHENTHPLGRQVFRYLNAQKDSPKNGQLSRDLKHTPADKNSIRTITNYSELPGKGVEATVDDINIRVGSAVWLEVDTNHKWDVENIAKNEINGDKWPEDEIDSHALERDASRVYVRIGDEVLGYFKVKTAYRSGLQRLLNSLSQKASLYMLSGDNAREKDNLRPFFDGDCLRFNQTPADKLEAVQQLRKEGKYVLMVGDGLNDAGALRSSTVGVSIAEDTSSFTPASDIIMSADALSKLDNVLDFAKSSRRIIYISFGISVLYNIVGLAYAVTGTLSPIVCAIIMPVSSVTVIAWTTLATHWSAWRKGLTI
jgi:P-type Cu+ transporter